MRSVLIICFNRPALTRRVFEAVREARPEFLYIASDGPRTDRPDDRERCAEVRDTFENIDWPCHVTRDFAETNLGCKQRILSAYERVFDEVDRAVILEDDIIVGPEFFNFCDTMLDRFADTPRITSVAGSSHVRSSRLLRSSYYFSRYPEMWGWAAYRRSFTNVNWDPDPQETAERLQSLIRRRDEPERWRELLQMTRDGRLSAWDYQYIISGILGDRLAVVPRVPLCRNSGFGMDATHTLCSDALFNRPITTLGQPIRHPKTIKRSAYLDFHRSMGNLVPKSVPYNRVRPYVQEIRRRMLREGADQLETTTLDENRALLSR